MRLKLVKKHQRIKSMLRLVNSKTKNKEKAMIYISFKIQLQKNDLITVKVIFCDAIGYSIEELYIP